MNVGMQISLWDPIFISFGYICRSGIAGSNGSPIFNFLRNLHTVFHSGHTNLHSYQQSTSVFFSPHSCQHLLPLVFLMTVILTGVRWYLVVLICSSLMISNTEHLFMYLLAIYLLQKNLYSAPLPILIGLFPIKLCELFIYLGYQIYDLQIFSPTS